MNKLNMPPSTFGVWRVTTEGDCEGRTTRQLGIHEGFIDDIAFKLADKAEYKLEFQWVDPRSIVEQHATRTEVHIGLSIESGTWDLNQGGRAHVFKEWLAGRDVEVQDGQYYGSVKLLAGSSPELRAQRELAAKRAIAMSKLSEEDKNILGLK